jgi:mono/diheme cytochrome c family protein
MRSAPIAILIASAATAHAEDADVASGHRLAQLWCGTCHQVATEDPLKPTPSLPELARLWSSPGAREIYAIEPRKHAELYAHGRSDKGYQRICVQPQRQIGGPR